MSGPAIEFGAVNVRLGGQDVLSEVTFAVAAGEIHCIVGPNGGGKTTLVRSLLGQVPYDGKITLDGNANPVIGYAPQSLDIDRTLPMTVLDVLAVMKLAGGQRCIDEPIEQACHWSCAPWDGATRGRTGRSR